MLLNESLLLNIPSYVFWKDKNGLFLGCNELFLKNIAGLSKYEDLVGKNDYDLTSKRYAVNYIKDDNYVLSTGKTIKQVEELPLADGTIIISETTKAPIMDGKDIVGILGVCHDITDRIRSENLKTELEKHKAITEEQTKFKVFVEQLTHLINSYKISFLNDKLGNSQISISDINIHLSRREREVLYYLSLHKSPKEIAQILTIIDQKEINHKTIQSIIDKQLYTKFQVYSIGELMELANIKNLIPFLLTD